MVEEFHRGGKHFVAPSLREALDGVRASLSRVGAPDASVRLLDRFLDTALDKWDGRYANPTYLALSLLPLPALDGAFAAARASGRLGEQDGEALEQAMRRFAATLPRWRGTHHGIAVRMLG